MLRRTISYGGASSRNPTPPTFPTPDEFTDDSTSTDQPPPVFPEREEIPTKLFSTRRRKAKQENEIPENEVATTRRFSLRRTKSFAGGAGPPTQPSETEFRVPAPPRPEAPSIGVFKIATTSFVSAGLSLFKGLNISSGESDTFRWGVAHTIGRRPYMEDRFVTHANLTPTDSIFGVFDGHGGELAAQYCVDNIPVQLKVNDQLQTDPEQALVETFERVDKDFCQMAARQMLDDGTTAVLCLVRDNVIWCANAGDSRCVMSRNAIAVPLSKDHKPNRPDERKRIVALGGFVKHLGVWRTQGVLAVSRAIGDLSLKKFVIPTPDVMQVEFGQDDEFLVIASDGLWDVLQNQDVVDILHTRANLLVKPEHAARALVTEAFRRGSYDNIAVVVVVLHHSPDAELPKQRSFARSSSKNKLDRVEEVG